MLLLCRCYSAAVVQKFNRRSIDRMALTYPNTRHLEGIHGRQKWRLRMPSGDECRQTCPCDGPHLVERRRFQEDFTVFLSLVRLTTSTRLPVNRGHSLSGWLVSWLVGPLHSDVFLLECLLRSFCLPNRRRDRQRGGEKKKVKEVRNVSYSPTNLLILPPPPTNDSRGTLRASSALSMVSRNPICGEINISL